MALDKKEQPQRRETVSGNHRLQQRERARCKKEQGRDKLLLPPYKETVLGNHRLRLHKIQLREPKTRRMELLELVLQMGHQQ